MMSELAYSKQVDQWLSESQKKAENTLAIYSVSRHINSYLISILSLS